MRSLVAFFFTILSISAVRSEQGVARMRELRTNIDPVRSFDLPDAAPRARIISTDFLQRTNRKMKKVYKDDSRQEDFRRWKLDELTDRDMRTSKEVKGSVRSPFGREHRKKEAEEENIGEFFPSRRFAVL